MSAAIVVAPARAKAVTMSTRCPAQVKRTAVTRGSLPRHCELSLNEAYPGRGRLSRARFRDRDTPHLDAAGTDTAGIRYQTWPAQTRPPGRWPVSGTGRGRSGPVSPAPGLA